MVSLEDKKRTAVHDGWTAGVHADLRPRAPGDAGKGGGEARGDSVRQVSQAVRERAGRDPFFDLSDKVMFLVIARYVIKINNEKNIDISEGQA
jgi:hypothetical protein